MKKIVTGIAAGAMMLTSAQMAMAAGQGFNTIKATDYYLGGKAIYEGWKVKGSMNISSAVASGGYVGKAYDPTKMWTDFNYQKVGATDSASAGTARFIGVKNYDNQINKTTTGANLTTFIEYAVQQGKATGAVSTANFDHATPAAVVAKTTSRNDDAITISRKHRYPS